MPDQRHTTSRTSATGTGERQPNNVMMFEIDDQTIVARVSTGDQDAFGMLVSKYQAPIYSLMQRSVHSREDAAELAQEVFLKAFARLQTFDPERSKFFSWLYAIGLNTARDHLRRRTIPLARDPSGDPAVPAGHAAVEDPEQPWVDMQTLRQALALLPMNQRETLLLKFRYSMTMQEIAEIFDISVSAVKMRIKRGLAELRRRMADED